MGCRLDAALVVTRLSASPSPSSRSVPRKIHRRSTREHVSGGELRPSRCMWSILERLGVPYRAGMLPPPPQGVAVILAATEHHVHDPKVLLAAWQVMAPTLGLLRCDRGAERPSPCRASVGFSDPCGSNPPACAIIGSRTRQLLRYRTPGRPWKPRSDLTLCSPSRCRGCGAPPFRTRVTKSGDAKRLSSQATSP